MSKAITAVNVYQIDGEKLGTPQIMGIPVSEITRMGVYPTRNGNVKLTATVAPSIYKLVNAAIDVKNGRHGFRTLYVNQTVAAIIADINA